MKKHLMTIFASVVLTGCFDDKSDLVSFTEQVKSTVPQQIDPMPEVPNFDHVVYEASDERSPFDAPKPEAIQEKIQQMSGCLSPDPRRRKQPLEKFSLSDLVMRGTLGDVNANWALVEASDSTLHRVAIGSYLGLYHGRITEIQQNLVKVVELIPDGAGCWQERETTVTMVKVANKG